MGIDIWSIACMVIELINGELLFDPDEEDDEQDFDNAQRNIYHLKQIHETVGKVPKALQCRDYYSRKGELSGFDEIEEVGLLARIQEKAPGLEGEDLENLCEFLTPMLQIDPRVRVDAPTALQHPWLNLTDIDIGDVQLWVEDLEAGFADDESEEDDSEGEETDEKEEETEEIN